ncbi:MAG: hypothetical protein WKF70_00035 [Chitinophagaceae bacterium]
MERIYLLLRDNIEQGPFTLSELAEQSLRPSDLIWIKGKSRFWSDTSSLHNSPAAPGTMRRGEDAAIEPLPEASGRKEEIRINTSGEYEQDRDNRGNDWNARTLPMPHRSNPPEKFKLIIHKKTSGTVSLSQLLFAALIGTVVLWIWRSPSSIISPVPKENVTYAARPAVFVPDLKPAEIYSPAPNQASNNLTMGTTRPGLPSGDPAVSANKTVSKQNKTSITNSKAKRKEVPGAKPAPIAELQPLPVETTLSTPPPAAQALVDTGNTQPVELEKKKTLKQVMRNLFKKKKKKETTSGEDTALTRSQYPS